MEKAVKGTYGRTKSEGLRRRKSREGERVLKTLPLWRFAGGRVSALLTGSPRA